MISLMNMKNALQIGSAAYSSTRSSIRRKAKLKSPLMVAAVALLAGCGPLITFGDGEPETVYSLSYETLNSGASDGPLLLISDPAFTEGLGGRRVSVRLGEIERTSLKNVRWSTNAGDLIRDYLVGSLRDNTGARTLGESGLDVKSTCRLNTYVWAMDFVPGSDSTADSVEFRMETSLINLIDGELIERKIFDARESAAGGSRAVMTGFNAGMKSMATDIGRWIKDNRLLDRCDGNLET